MSSHPSPQEDNTVEGGAFRAGRSRTPGHPAIQAMRTNTTRPRPSTVLDADISRILREHREVIVKDISQEICDLKNALSAEIRALLDDRIGPLEYKVEKCLENVVQIPREVSKHQQRGLSLGKRTMKQQQAAERVPGIDEIKSKRRVTWAITVNVCRSLADDLREAVSSSSVSNGSKTVFGTLASFLFAVQGSDLKTAHTTALGKQSSKMLRDIISTLIWSARRGSVFKRARSSSPDPREKMPDWIAAFTMQAARDSLGEPTLGPKDDSNVTIEKRQAADIDWIEVKLSQENLSKSLRKERWLLDGTVSSVVSGAESYRSTASFKRQRSGRYEISHYEEMMKTCERAIRVVRTAVAEHLTQGRSKSRDSAFKSFGFVLEVLEGVEGMRSDGFRVEVPEIHAQEERLYLSRGNIPDVIGHPKLAHEGMTEEERISIDRSNKEQLENLANKFPSLHLRITYRRSFSNFSDDVSQHQSSSNQDNDGEEMLERRNDDSTVKEWSVSESLSLHQVALSFLFEAFRSDSESGFLRSCKDSIMAVQTIAICFRGLIKRSLKLQMHEVERRLLGNVYLNEKQWLAMKSSSDATREETSAEGRRAFMFVAMKKDRQTLGKVIKRMAATRKDYEEHLRDSTRPDDDSNGADVGGELGQEYLMQSDIDEYLDPLEF